MLSYREQLPPPRLAEAVECFWSLTHESASAITHRVMPDGCADMATLSDAMPTVAARTPAQRAFAWMESVHGCVTVDDIARQAGLSPRQFRRVCLDHTGLSPKLLAQVLRFRHAASRIHLHAGDHAGLSIDCGYFDQSHFIAEFQRFSGRAPGASWRSSATHDVAGGVHVR